MSRTERLILSGTAEITAARIQTTSTQSARAVPPHERAAIGLTTRSRAVEAGRERAASAAVLGAAEVLAPLHRATASIAAELCPAATEIAAAKASPSRIPAAEVAPSSAHPAATATSEATPAKATASHAAAASPASEVAPATSEVATAATHVTPTTMSAAAMPTPAPMATTTTATSCECGVRQAQQDCGNQGRTH